MQALTKNPRIIALIGVLTALCLAVQLSPRPPNVEFTSLFTFILGFMFGSIMGISFGSFVMFVNAFFSPWGFAGLNMPFQIAGMALVGLAGGLYRTYLQSCNSAKFYIEVAVLGAFLTVLYDLITNFGVALSHDCWNASYFGGDNRFGLWHAFFYSTYILKHCSVWDSVLPSNKGFKQRYDGEKSWLKKECSYLRL